MTTTFTRQRFQRFVDNTTIHGLKETSNAPNWPLKLLWSTIMIGFTCIMCYQIYHLTAHFLEEPVVVMMRQDDKHYELPLTLLLVPTSDLFNASPDASKALADSSFDNNTRFYIRSLIDANMTLPGDFYDADKGKDQFDSYLRARPHLTWHDVVSPFVANVSYWLNSGRSAFKFNIVNRSISAYMTYHYVKPIFEIDNATITVKSGNTDSFSLANSKKESTKEIILEAEIDFGSMPESNKQRPMLSLTSYGLLMDAVRLKPGKTYKFSFDIVGHERISLRRRPCIVSVIQYQPYDLQACDEQCHFEAEHRWTPRSCYHQQNYEYGFYQINAMARPCSHGARFNATQQAGRFAAELPTYSNSAANSGDKDIQPKNLHLVRKTYEKCVAERCVEGCQQMSAKFYAKSSDLHEILGNRSMLYMTWPAPGSVPVYAETLQYTLDGYVGQVGGLIGLWLGASIVSVCDLFCACCSCCCWSAKQRKNSKRSLRLVRMSRDEEHFQTMPA